MTQREEKVNMALDLIFTKYDEDHNNSLDVHELQKLLKELYPKIGIKIVVTE